MYRRTHDKEMKRITVEKNIQQNDDSGQICIAAFFLAGIGHRSLWCHFCRCLWFGSTVGLSLSLLSFWGGHHEITFFFPQRWWIKSCRFLKFFFFLLF